MNRAYTAHFFLVAALFLFTPAIVLAVGTQADQKCLKGTQYDYTCDYPNTEKKMVNGKEVRVYCWRGAPCPDVTNNITTPGKCVAELKCEATKPAGQATPEQKENCVGGECTPTSPTRSVTPEPKPTGSIIDQTLNPENLEPDKPRTAPPSTTNVNETLDPKTESTWANWYDKLKTEVKDWWTNDPEQTPVPSFEKESITNLKPSETPATPETTVPNAYDPKYIDVPVSEIEQKDPNTPTAPETPGETPPAPSTCDSFATCAAKTIADGDLKKFWDNMGYNPKPPELGPTFEELKQNVDLRKQPEDGYVRDKKDWIDQHPQVFQTMPTLSKMACDYIGGCADPDAIAKGWAGTVCQESRCNPSLLHTTPSGKLSKYQGLGQNSPNQWERTYMIYDEMSEDPRLSPEHRRVAREIADSIIESKEKGYDPRFGKTPSGVPLGATHFTAYQIENGLGKYANETNEKFIAGAAQLTQLSPGAWNREDGLTPGDVKNLRGNKVYVTAGMVPADAINAITRNPTYNKNFTTGIQNQTLALNNAPWTPTQVASYNPSYAPSYTPPTWTSAQPYTAIVESGSPIAPSAPTAIASYDPSPVVSYEPGPAPAATYEPSPGYSSPTAVDTPVRIASMDPGFVPSNLNGGWTTTDFPTSEVFGPPPAPVTMPEIPRLSPITGPQMDPTDWTGVPNVAFGYTPQTAAFEPSPPNVFLDDNIPAGRPIALDNPFPETGTLRPDETTTIQSPQQPPLNIQPGGERSAILASNPDAPQSPTSLVLQPGGERSALFGSTPDALQPTGNSWLDYNFLYTDERIQNDPDSLTPAWPHAPQPDIAPLTPVERGPDLVSPSAPVVTTRETFDAWWGDTPWSIAHTEEPRVPVEVPTPTGEPPFTEGPRPIVADNPFPETGTLRPDETTTIQSPQQPPLNIQPGGERSAILASNPDAPQSPTSLVIQPGGERSAVFGSTPDAPQPTSETPRFVAPTEIDWTRVPNVAYGYTPQTAPEFQPSPPNVFLADNEPVGRGPIAFQPDPESGTPGPSETTNLSSPQPQAKPTSIWEQLPPYEQGPRLDPFPMPKAQPEPAVTPPKTWSEIVGGTREKIASVGKDIVDTFRTGVWDWPQQERPAPTEPPFDDTKVPTPEHVARYEIPDAQQSILEQLRREGIEVKTGEEPKTVETPITPEPKPSTEPKPTTTEPPKTTTPQPEPPKTTTPQPEPPKTTAPEPPKTTTTPQPGPGKTPTAPQPGPGKTPSQPTPSGTTNFGSGLSSAFQSFSSMLSNVFGSLMQKLTGQGQQQPQTSQPQQQTSPQTQTPQPNQPAPKPKPVVSAAANPPEIAKGGSATLYWTALGVTECRVAKPDGEVVGRGTPSGSARVTGVQTTTDYSLVCTGAGGVTATSSIQLKVRP